MDMDRSAAIRYKNNQVQDVTLQGYKPSMAATSNIQIDAGRFLIDGESGRRAAVPVIGNDRREKFLPGVDPVGEILNIDGRPLEVIGASQQLGSNFGPSRDSCVSIPSRYISSGTARARTLATTPSRPIQICSPKHRTRSGCYCGPTGICGWDATTAWAALLQIRCHRFGSNSTGVIAATPSRSSQCSWCLAE